MPKHDPRKQRWGDGVDWDAHVLQQISREAKRSAYSTRDLLALLDEAMDDPEVLKLYGEASELAYSVHQLNSRLSKPSLWASLGTSQEDA